MGTLADRGGGAGQVLELDTQLEAPCSGAPLTGLEGVLGVLVASAGGDLPVRVYMYTYI